MPCTATRVLSPLVNRARAFAAAIVVAGVAYLSVPIYAQTTTTWGATPTYTGAGINLGVGISPIEPLQVHVGSGLNVGMFNSTYPGVGSFNDNFSAWGNLQLNNNMYLLSNGFVGIGTTAPYYPLQLRLSSGLNVGLLQGTYPAIGSTNDNFSAWGNLQVNNSMYLLSNGNVGIGTTAPPYKLSVTDAFGQQEAIVH